MTSAPTLTEPRPPERPNADRALLGWFDTPLAGSLGTLRDRTNLGHHAWLATQLDRSGLDLLVLGEAAEGPDPMAVAPLVASVTEALAVVAPVDLSALPPWMAARALATLDHLAAGRVGWYVTGPGSDEPERAAEYVELVRALWGSWDADALVMDRAENVYVDHTKVRPIHFEGRFYSSRGPLNTLPPPQGTPPLVQPAATGIEAELPVGGPGPGHLLVVTPTLGPSAEHTAADGTPVLTGPAPELAERITALCAGSGARGILLRAADGSRRTASALVEELVPALHALGTTAPTTGGHLRPRLTAPVRRRPR